MIGIMLTAFLIKNFSANSIKAEQDAKTMEALGNAKDGLIGWSASHPTWPGVMPFPDRGTDPAGYNGVSDCVNTGLDFPHLIGKLPLLSESPCISPQNGVGNIYRDASGEVLWYAVSRNLIRTNGIATTPIINPAILNVDPLKPNPYDGTDTTGPYPWIVVRDMNGVVVSDRVAVVIISPGPPLTGQSRSNTATPFDFLDQVTIGAITYSNHDYDGVGDDGIGGEDFIIGDITSGTFNDRLVYITIDELMYALENRAANEISNALLTYQSANLGNLPNAAPLGSIDNYVCQAPLSGGPHLADPANAGLLPITSKVAGSDFNCEIDRSGLITTITCDNNFTNKDSISFGVGPTGLPFNPASGLCTLSDADKTCTCTGEGECGTPGPFFLCDEVECRTNVSTGTIKINSSAGYEFTEASGSCSASSPSSLSCNSFGAELTCTTNPAVYAGSGSRDTCDTPALTTLPAWITTNRWQDYFYYRSAQNEISRLSSGGRGDIDALLVGTGGAIVNPSVAVSKGANQLRPSCEVNDYLDSIENTNADSIFDSYIQPRNLNYNDRVYIVAP
ncbi:MAG: hypothetical protein U1E13_05440 [Methylophilaceae bacterium]|nr:hypothetical protein [Methylophilaceae bacterium]